MNDLVDVATVRNALQSSLSDLGANLAAFVPNLVGAALLLIVGWAMAWVADRLGARILRAVGVDRMAARLQVGPILERAGVGMTLSRVVGRLLFWLILLTFLLSSIRTLDLPGAAATLDRLIAYLPLLVGAALILLVGLVLARFVGSVVGSAAAAAGFGTARRIGFLAQLLIAVFVAVVAMEQLRLPTATLLLPVAVLIGAVVLSAGFALALGARPIITHILAGHFLKQSFPRQAVVEIRGRRGVIERIGPTDTLLRNGDESWSVPNAQLLEDVVTR